MPPPPPRRPAEILGSLEAGTRVVVRYRIEGGFTDALGELLAASDAEATVRTRKGEVVIKLADVVAAKPVPPPPPRRGARPGS